MNTKRTYFIPFSHSSPEGYGFGSTTVTTTDGLMTPTRLTETMAFVNGEHPGRDIVILGFFPLDREPDND